jgi:hypothetical protein
VDGVPEAPELEESPVVIAPGEPPPPAGVPETDDWHTVRSPDSEHEPLFPLAPAYELGMAAPKSNITVRAATEMNDKFFSTVAPRLRCRQISASSH